MFSQSVEEAERLRRFCHAGLNGALVSALTKPQNALGSLWNSVHCHATEDSQDAQSCAGTACPDSSSHNADDDANHLR